MKVIRKDPKTGWRIHDSVEEAEEELKKLGELQKQMVGTLYPGIVEDQRANLRAQIYRLKNGRQRSA